MFFLFICLGSEEYLTSHGRAAEKHDKNDKKKSHFPFTLLLAFLGEYGGDRGAGGVIGPKD